MKDIPVFDTQHGVASLILKQIPYRKEAYIRVQDVQPGQLRELIRECAAFCRMAGAERVYAAGHRDLQQYPLHAAVLEMRGQVRLDREKIRNIFPVTEETVGRWRQVYNERMAEVDNAGALERADEVKILSSGGAYFIHSHGTLLGIGWLEGGRLLVIASVVPGAGELVAHTLLSVAPEEDILLEVASTNAKAIRLYEKLGFLQTRVCSQWYEVSDVV